MSASDEQGTSTETGQRKETGQGPRALTPRDVSDIVKVGLADALKDFQVKFESKFKEEKEESEKALASLKKATEVEFRFKGNKEQFLFNDGIIGKVDKAVAKIQQDSAGASDILKEEVLPELRKRNKLIRLADKSDAGKMALVSDEWI